MERIKTLRENKGMSQQRLAFELNVTQSMLSKYERGKTEPDVTIIRRLAKFFYVSSDYLLELSDDKINIPSFGLTDDEKEVLFGFKRLDSVQKQKLQAYLKGLLQE